MADDGQTGRRPNNNNANNQPRKKSTTVSNPLANPRPSSAGSNPSAKTARSTSTTKKATVTPSSSTSLNSRLAAGDAISRPSSTDSGVKNVSDNGGGSAGGNRNKPRQNSRGAARKVSSQSQGGGANRSNTSTPVGGTESPASGDALSSLKRVIGDLKQIPPGATGATTAAPANPTPPGVGAGVNRVASGGGPPDVGAGPPRHRKSASAGNPASGPAPGFGPNFTAGAGGFSNQLGPMHEDAEDGYSYVESEDYNDQPGFSQPAPQSQPIAQQASQGNYNNNSRGMQHQPMGSFSAPRFQNYGGGNQQQNQQQQQQGEYNPQSQAPGEFAGATGRPQLAPNFTFGGNRRRVPSVSGPPAGDAQEDLAFQFPPQQFENPNANRRDPNAPTGLIAEQVCISQFSRGCPSQYFL